MKDQFKPSTSSKLLTAVPMAMGAFLISTAIAITGAMHVRSAHAEAVAAATPTTAFNVAAADTSATDGAKDDGFRAKMREHMQERAQEHAKQHPPIDKKLTSDQVRDIVAGRLAMRGNSNVKVGKVTAKADGVVAVDIVTKTGALVSTREISTKTGLPVKLEKAMAEHRMGGRDGHGGRGGRMMAHNGHRGGHDGMRGGEHRDLALTADQAKKLAEARLIMMGNKNLKVGAVKEKDADTISIEIVASDNSLVSQHLIDRHTGRPHRES